MMYLAEKQSEEVGNIRGLLLQKSSEKKQSRQCFEEQRKRRNDDLQRLSRILKRIEDLEKKLANCETEIKKTKENIKSTTKLKIEASKQLDAQRWKEETAKIALQSYKDKSHDAEKKHSVFVNEEGKMNTYIGQTNASSKATKAEIDVKLHQLVELRYKKEDLRKRCVEHEVKYLSLQERNKETKIQLKETLSDLVISKEENSRIKVDCEDARNNSEELKTLSSQLTRERDELLYALVTQDNAVKLKKRELHEEKSRSEFVTMELQDLQSRLEELEMAWQLSLHKSNQLDLVPSSVHF